MSECNEVNSVLDDEKEKKIKAKTLARNKSVPEQKIYGKVYFTMITSKVRVLLFYAKF